MISVMDLIKVILTLPLYILYNFSDICSHILVVEWRDFPFQMFYRVG